jgi:hypothetical protein
MATKEASAGARPVSGPASGSTRPPQADLGHVSEAASASGPRRDGTLLQSGENSSAVSSEKVSKPSSALAVGAFLIFGAYAAGVVGFRYSRFAVGKEIHRGWGNYQRYSRERLEREILERLQRAAQHNWAEKEARRREAFMAAEERARRELFRRYLEWERRFRGGVQSEAFSREEQPETPPRAAPGTHYATLGVSPSATSSEIRKAYLERAKALHPDSQHSTLREAVQGSADADRKRPLTAEERHSAFQKVVEAYQVLSNPESRRKYDSDVLSSWRR